MEAQQRALQENTPLRAVPVQMQMNLNNTSADESEPKFDWSDYGFSSKMQGGEIQIEKK